MDIKYKNYTLKQTNDRFDLYETVIRQKKDSKDTYEAKKEIGYGLILEAAIKRLIMEELAKDNNIVDLDTFLKAYKNEYEELTKTLNL